MKAKPAKSLPSNLENYFERVGKGWDRLYAVSDEELRKLKNAIGTARAYISKGKRKTRLTKEREAQLKKALEKKLRQRKSTGQTGSKPSA